MNRNDLRELKDWAGYLCPEYAATNNGNPTVPPPEWEKISETSPMAQLVKYQQLLSRNVWGPARDKVLSDLEILVALEGKKLYQRPSFDESDDVSDATSSATLLLQLEVERGLGGIVEPQVVVGALAWLMIFEADEGPFKYKGRYGDIWYLTVGELEEQLQAVQRDKLDKQKLRHSLEVVRRDPRLFPDSPNDK